MRFINKLKKLWCKISLNFPVLQELSHIFFVMRAYRNVSVAEFVKK